MTAIGQGAIAAQPRPFARFRAPATVAPGGRWDALSVALGVYIITAVGRTHQLVPAIEPLRITLVAALLAILFWAATRERTRRLAPVMRLPLARWIFALGAWMVLSIPGALWPGGAFHQFTDETAKATVMFVVLVAAVRGFADVERFALAYLLSVGVYAGAVLARFKIGAAPSWRLARLYDYDANEFATLIVMCLPLVVYFAFRPGPAWRRVAAIASGAALTVGFVWSGSRGGFLALLATGGYLLLRYRGIRSHVRMGAGIVITLAFFAAASDTYWDKMRTILAPGGDYNITAAQGRVQVWKRGLGYMLDHPILGVGAGNFPVAEGTISPLVKSARPNQGVKWSVSHNSFIQVGAELGLPGLAIFLGILGTAFAELRTVGRIGARHPGAARPPPEAQLAQALTGSLIAYVIGGFFLSLAYRDLLFVLLALIAGLWKAAAMAGALARPTLPRSSTSWSS